MSHKRWIIKKPYPPDFGDKLPGYNPVILQLLFDRGFDSHEKVDEFLNPDYTQDVHEPFLFNDMQKAVERIMQAVKNQEKILIHGDYDADGVTGIVLLEKTLRKLGAENIEVFIPHRELDGYGLNSKTAQKAISEKFNLVITVDCGITNNEPIKKLKQADIDTIVTDHHLAGDELPEAMAILNCSLKQEKYPFKKLAGVGVVFKLAQALFKSQTPPNPPFVRGGSNEYEAFEKWLLDLVAIGTIGDVSPILGENRTLVKYGLMVLNKTQRLGLRELIRTCSLSGSKELNKDLPVGSDLYDLNVYNVSYQLVPRINAAGRIDHANLAYELLTTQDEVEAIALARDIHEKNLARQKIADQMLEEAKQILGKITQADKILIAAKKNWLVGVIGLVAGKLKDEFSRPVMLFAKEGQKYVGSGRSIAEFNITQALQECDEFLERFGGHSQACGLTIEGEENYKKFIDKITHLAQEELKDVELVPSLEIDVELKLKDLDWELWDELEKFEPFAEANPLPLFCIRNVIIEDISLVGKDQSHLRFYLSQDDIKQKAISFGTAAEWQDNLKVGDKIDVVVEFGVNEWNGNRELQFKIIDFHANNDTSTCE